MGAEEDAGEGGTLESGGLGLAEVEALAEALTEAQAEAPAVKHNRLEQVDVPFGLFIAPLSLLKAVLVVMECLAMLAERGMHLGHLGFPRTDQSVNIHRVFAVVGRAGEEVLAIVVFVVGSHDCCGLR